VLIKALRPVSLNSITLVPGGKLISGGVLRRLAQIHLDPISTVSADMDESPTSRNVQAEIADEEALYANKYGDIHMVPVEIWRQIFEDIGIRHSLQALTPLTWPFNAQSKTSSRPVVLSISRVCRYFRQITLAMPVWWSAIDLTRSMPEIKTFLERSASVPLTITNIRFSLFQSQQLASTYLSLKERIVAIDTPVDFSDLISIRYCRNLRHLMVQGALAKYWTSTSRYYDGSETFVPLLDHFESLQTLWWHYPQYNEIVDILISSNTKCTLTSLHISVALSDTSLLSLLRCCPMLENASLNSYSHGTQNLENERVVRLTHLRNFWIEFNAEDRWFGKLEFQSTLQSFHFNYRFANQYPVTQKLNVWTESLIMGSHPDPGFVASWLATEPGVLKRLTFISKLMVYRTALTDYLWALDVDKNSQVPCSQLEEVCIEHEFSPLTEFPSLESDLVEYRNIISRVSASRVKVGRPPLRLMWNGKVVYPELNKGSIPTRPQEVKEMTETENRGSNPHSVEKKGTPKRLFNVSPFIKRLRANPRQKEKDKAL
jgi:hypothetical protein